MEKQQVETKGTMKDMKQYTNLDQQTIEGAIQLVEQTANVEVNIPDQSKQK